MSLQDGPMARWRLWYLAALILACCLAFSACGTSKRTQGASTQIEEPIDSLVDHVPELIKEGKPRYPRQAREEGWEGTVWVNVLVDTKGEVQRVKLWSSSGYKELDDAAVEAAKNSRFKPGVQNGRRVSVWVRYAINFSLGHK